MTLACHPQWFSGSSGAPAAGGATDQGTEGRGEEQGGAGGGEEMKE